MTFNVVFRFDDDNSTSTRIEAESARALIEEIKACKDWYEFELNGTNFVINMQQVTSFTVRKR
ncbi:MULTISPECIES: hypothetical protein [Bacillus]|uniref:hypothetical protein n=1 Tax=Bacillus TaxID=1386 RepID=UPI000D027649|nr:MULTISPECIES: hypothetical protein [Bacillus]MBJ7570859.1 hypothetical protein [Bacillus halotolerans]MCE0742237.1 hypothetical protein [Bacillus sp. G16]MED4649672.1 hypothetical protein [Bacillus inaquosorum]MED4790604.1 hypothetical protein [Bacillus inaquosorum]PRP56819.1 hypothetical protein C7B71_02420 [Bacillus halotolerans]